MPEVDVAPPRPHVAPGDEPAVTHRLRHHASLDGLRALAVLAVIAYHFNFTWARGGFLGVDLFFVLSGFLITTLLILEWRRTERIALRQFWGRRARRLLPALMIVLVFVAIITVFAIQPWNRASVRDDGLASLFYVANWRFVAAKQGYFELFSAPSPLRHMWSLAIEEQFYLVWPLIAYVSLRAARGSLKLLSAVCIAGIAASAAVMAVTYRRADPSRAYYGTDARAHALLLGAFLAIVLIVWPLAAAARRRLQIASALAFVVMLYAWHVATGTSARYYHGGSVAYAVLACIVIAGAMQPGLLRQVLSFGPLTWIGRISYGLYLFHWPLNVYLVPTRVHGLHGLPLDLLRLTATFAAATISFYLVELPIRERRLPTLPRRRAPQLALARTRGERRNIARWLALPAVACTLAVVLASTTGASPAPSYLAGGAPPAYRTPPPPPHASGPTPPAAQSDSPPGASAPSTDASLSAARDAPGRSFKAPVPPSATYPWAYGDPLFCGEPRPNESQAAADEARKLGPAEVGDTAGGLRVLIVGDSTACSLYPGLKAVGGEVGATVGQAAVFGCGVASGQITTTRNEQITPHSERCPAMVDEVVAPALFELRPDVVVWMSIWEKSDMVVGRDTLVSGTPAGDAEMLRRMDAELARLTSDGAKVVVLTEAAAAPNDAQGISNTSNAVDDESYARLNRILERFAATNPHDVTLVDLAKQVCPKGPPCPEDVDGLRLRPDGRHFTPTAAAIEAQWLMPQIVEAAREPGS